MSGWRCNGGYLGPRPAGPSSTEASGWWDSRTQMQYERAATWPKSVVPPAALPVSGALVRINPNVPSSVYDSATGGSLIVAGSAIGRVEDATGNEHHAFNSDSATRPLLAEPSWAGGRRTIDFTGTTRLENWSFPALGTGEYTVFTVISCNNTTAGGSSGAATAMQLGRGTSASAMGVNNGALLWNGRTGWLSNVARNGGVFLQTTTPTLAANTPYLFVGRRNGDTFSHWINGTATTPATATVSHDIIGGYALGQVRATNGWSQAWPGHVGEHIVFDRALTDQERQDVENQLMDYWALA